MKHNALHSNLSITAPEFIQYCEEAGYFQLNMSSRHVAEAARLDTAEAESHGHRDPFDRLLVAQAKAENYSFITHDSKIDYYNEKCIIKV
jgi:PIN domain nuclease of toxin-antitoxin system